MFLDPHEKLKFRSSFRVRALGLETLHAGKYTKLQIIYTVDSRYSGSLKYGHLDIPAIWLGTEC